jgi:hypothetical protein
MNPGASTATIGDLIPGVQLALQNRTDINAYNPQKYIRDAIQELTLSNPFEELRQTGPMKQLTVGQFQYPVSFFLNAGDDYSQIQSLSIFTNPNTNTVAFAMKYDTPAAMQTLIYIPGGLPAKWTRFGSNIWVGPQPNQTYTIFMSYQRRHPFPSGATGANLNSAPVYMPVEWLEIVEYCAAYRLAAGPLRWMDGAKDLRTMLYGDPAADDRMANLGLIKARFYQQMLDQRIHSRQLTPVVGRY